MEHWEDGNLMTDMLKSIAPRIAVVTFAIPETVTFPFVSFDMDTLNAKVVFDSAVRSRR